MDRSNPCSLVVPEGVLILVMIVVVVILYRAAYVFVRFSCDCPADPPISRNRGRQGGGRGRQDGVALELFGGCY